MAASTQTRNFSLYAGYYRQRVQALAQALAAGQITLEEWQRRMAQELANLYATVEAISGVQVSPPLDTLAQVVAILSRNDASAQEVYIRSEAFLNEARDLVEQPPPAESDSPRDMAVIGAGGILAAIFGRRRSPRQVRIDRAALREFQDYYNARVTLLASDLVNGAISLPEWRNAMRTELYRLHYLYGFAGAGGVDNATRQDLQAIQRNIERQWGYLDRWALDIAQNGIRSEQDLLRRARMYGNAAEATLLQTNSLALGLPLLPAYPKDGSTECRTNCACGWHYERLQGNGNWNVYWRLNPAEHCDTCLSRAMQWNPLQVRRGVIQPYARAGLFA